MYLTSDQVKSVYPTAYRSADKDPQADNTTEYNVTNTVRRIGSRNYIVRYDESVSGSAIALVVSIEGYIFEITKEGLNALKTAAENNNLYLYIRVLSSDSDYRNKQLLPADASEVAVSPLDVEGSFTGLGYTTNSADVANKPYIQLFDAEGNVPSSSYGILDTSKIIDRVNDDEKALNERVTTQDLDVNGPADITGIVTVGDNTVDSINPGKGALVVKGGVGISQNVNIARHVFVGGSMGVESILHAYGGLQVGMSGTSSRRDTTLYGSLDVKGAVSITGVEAPTRITLINRDNNKYIHLISDAVTDNRAITLPDKSGTIRVTGDVTSGPSGSVSVAKSTHTHTYSTTAVATASASCVNAHTGYSTTSVMTGVKVSSTSKAAPNGHTHSVTAAGTVSLGQNTTASGGVAHIVGGSKSAVATGVTVSSTSSAAPGGHVHTFTPTGTVSLGSNTTASGGVAYLEPTSWDVTYGVLSLTTKYFHPSFSGTGGTTSTNSGTNFNAATGVTVSATTEAYTGLTTKYFHPSFSGTEVTTSTNSGTGIDAATAVAKDGTVDALTSVSTTSVTKADHTHSVSGTTSQPSATQSVASTNHTHTLIDQ